MQTGKIVVKLLNVVLCMFKHNYQDQQRNTHSLHARFLFNQPVFSELMQVRPAPPQK